jgi:hypothetical protein
MNMISGLGLNSTALAQPLTRSSRAKTRDRFERSRELLNQAKPRLGFARRGPSSSLGMSGGGWEPPFFRINQFLPAKVNPLTPRGATVPSRNSLKRGADKGANLRLSRGVPVDSGYFERGQIS